MSIYKHVLSDSKRLPLISECWHTESAKDYQKRITITECTEERLNPKQYFSEIHGHGTQN